MPNDAPKPQPREPFSLRELFCLTTLAGLLLALMLGTTWSNHERWLLGLTLGSSLLGIVIARSCQRRGWLVGFLAGTVAGLIAVGIISQDWLAVYNEQITQGTWTASELAGYRNEFLAAGVTTVVLALLLALLAVAAFGLLVWATDASEKGLLPAARRHPYRTGLIVVIVSTLVVCAANIDFLLAPNAWSPRHFIPLKRLEQPIFSNHGLYTVRGGSLSRSGDWLLVEGYLPGVGRETAETEMYRLDPQPHLVPIAERPERACFVTFDCAANRLIFLEWLGEFYDDNPEQNHRLRVVDLDRGTGEVLTEKPRENDVHSLQWLPDGGLVIHYGDSWNGKNGFTKLKPLSEPGVWSRQESDVVTAFCPQSDTTLETIPEGVRILDLVSSREVASFDKDWLAKMMAVDLSYVSGYHLEISPDRRFLLAGSKIYDRETQTLREWHVADGYPQLYFHAFTPRGYAVYDSHSNFIAWRPYWFLSRVPLGNRLLTWLTREPVRIVDPATGLKVARTRPLPESADTITLSHDGSRMAVFTDRGVYVYDVPAKFR